MKLKTKFLIVLSVVMLMSCNFKKSSDSQADMEKTDAMAANSDEFLLLVGTYTDSGSDDGIYVYRFDSRIGVSELLSKTKAENPSFLTLSSDEQFVFAVGENGADKSTASSFSLNKNDGTLAPINTRSTGGADPCYIEIDRDNGHLFTANYSGGSISVLPVDSGGKLSETEMILKFSGSGTDSVRQKQPHLHSVRFSPDGSFLFAADLGRDKIYRFNSIGSVFQGQPTISESSLTEFDTPAGTGPRHFDFHPSGKYFYLLGELSGNVIAYDYNNGNLTEKQVIASDTVGAKGSGDIHVSPDGRFLYSSNRLEADGIAIFAIDSENGTLTKVGYQLTAKHPRNFAITPNGKLLLVAARDENKIQVFSIDRETGLLENLNNDIEVSKPVCIKFASIR